MKNLFKINREERMPLLVAFVLFVMLNALMVVYHHEQFMNGGHKGFWTIFSRDFEISGFDFYTYLTLSKWVHRFVIFSHFNLLLFIYCFYFN